MSLQRETYAKKKRNKRLMRFGILVLLFVVVTGILSFISFRKEIRINKVELSGGILVTQEEVQAETLSFLHGTYFWLFPKDNVFLYPRELLASHLKDRFRRIDTIHLRIKDTRTLLVEIGERKPFALWCDTAVASTTTSIDDSNAPEHCYFMDDNSTIFVEAPYFSGNAYFKYYGHVSSTTPAIGTEFISSSTEFSELYNFIASFQKLSASPKYIIAQDDGAFTLVLRSGAKVYFDTKESLSKTILNLSALLSSDIFSTTSDPTATIDYIDARFGNKLFYKLKTIK